MNFGQVVFFPKRVRVRVSDPKHGVTLRKQITGLKSTEFSFKDINKFFIKCFIGIGVYKSL